MEILMISFSQAITLFNADKIGDLSDSREGLRFLKLRSLSRKGQMEAFARKFQVDILGAKSKDVLSLIFASNVSDDDIDSFIREVYITERAERKKYEESLLNELYKVNAFDWGGLHQNSLEKTIVDNYVKKIRSYDALGLAIDNELQSSLRSYVLASWYNHWSSIIIEDVFKDHKNVLPAVGLIKKIDFFVKNRPFDLKVTYLPEGYIKYVRKAAGEKPELTLLKKSAKENKIPFDITMPDSFLLQDIWKKLDDHPSSLAKQVLSEINNKRESILKECVDNPDLLVKWLYENQGVRRFDASNRLFLVLVDKENFFESWKLKRAKQLISANVNNYLNDVPDNPGFSMNFNWEGKEYKTVSDIVFVIK
jgi:hypothetical protein